MFINTDAFAQTWPNLPAKISGKIINGLNSNDSIVVNINEDNPKWSYKKKIVPINADGFFQILLDTIHQPSAIRMVIKGRNYMIFEREIEPGDSLFLEIDAVVSNPANKYSGYMPKYSGNNVGKYRCDDSIAIFRQGWDNQRKNLYNQFVACRYSDEYYTKLYEFLQTGYGKVIMILDNFKGQLSPAMYEYLKARYIAFYVPWSSTLRSEYSQTNNLDNKARIIKNFGRYQPSKLVVSPDIAGYDTFFLGHLFSHIQVETWFEYDGKKYSFKLIYEKLKSRYSGFLRERLLAYFLYWPGNMLYVENYDPADFAACLADAKSITKDPWLKKVLAQKTFLKSGTAAYPFALPDTSGKIVKLADLKGKVILLDLWGLGCSGCAQFYQLFEKEIQPHLANEPNFKFVSLNADNSTERWTTGIKSGKYTNDHHINLYLEGKGVKHPFAKFYSIVSAPFIILIDKQGNLITKIELGLSGAELLKTIKTALIAQ
ncbi:TlpA family protein disulfide reductase [Pedobacter sp. AK017]|uniref:TlpA family protein disulfide reductase n=1 Tax=Pedobacter sp. AK017 TaxID=2723073 RepID=UPI00161921E3|nr:TlpA disulfide reductase family protein [Pedobacter sp. AK017]